ncbi:MAG TPA: hypothetical protein VEA44_09095 [Caulobacter sp.]|nr:hypothetical protein [Caulobacter sp.]
MGAVMRGSLAALRRRWLLLLLMILVAFGGDLAINALDGPDLAEGAPATPLSVLWQAAYDLLDGLVAGVVIALALSGAKGERFRLAELARRVASALPTLACGILVMSGPGWITTLWPIGGDAVDRLPISAVYYLVMATVLGMTLPAALDLKLSPPAAARVGLRLTAGRRWLLLGIWMLAAVAAVLMFGLGYVPFLFANLGDHWAAETIEYPVETLMNVLLVGLYIELDRLRGQGPERVADTFA